MNILMVHPHDLFDRAEPWTIRIKSFAKEFVKKSYRVKLCYFPLAINTKHYPKNLDSIETIPFNRTPSPKVFVENTIRLIKLCKWADIIHLQKCHHYASIPTVIAAYAIGKPLHYDWDDWEEKIWLESIGRGIHSKFIALSFKVLERFLPTLADSVSCASDFLRDLARNYGVKEEYIFNSPVGVDLEKFSPHLDGSWVKEKHNIKGDIVLYIGQLHGAQYVDLFIKAANIVLHKSPDLKFMIVGEGFWEYKLRRLVHDLGITDKIIFAGSVTHDEIPYYIAASNICVAPFKDTKVTRCKSPLKIVEYLASGKPIVVSNIREAKKMIDGAGVLVEPGNYYALAEGILDLVENEQLRIGLEERARKAAEEKHGWETTADTLLSAYEKILNKS